jgi:hypothetical protein
MRLCLLIVNQGRWAPAALARYELDNEGIMSWVFPDGFVDPQLLATDSERADGPFERHRPAGVLGFLQDRNTDASQCLSVQFGEVAQVCQLPVQLQVHVAAVLTEAKGDSVDIVSESNA